MKKASCAAIALIAVLLMWTFALNEVWAQSGPPALPTPPPGRLLDVWRFETNLNSLLGDAPLFSTNTSFTPDWDGNGLLIDSTNAASLKYAVVTSTGRTNIDLANGTFEFWFSPDWNSTDWIGNWGTLLEVGTWDTNTTAAGAWGLYVSPDGGGIYFSAQTNGVTTNYLSAPIAWNQGEWHSLVVTYSATNSSLYLEGQFVTNGPGITVVPSAAVVSNGFALGSDCNGTGLLQARGVFNNLITYDYEMDADTISNNYNIDSQFVYPLPSSGGGFHIGGLETDSLPSLPPAPGGGGTNSGGGPTFNSPNYTTNDFWLEALSLGTNVCNSDPNSLTLMLHGTIADIDYQILSTTNLQPSNTVWTLEKDILGSDTTNFTIGTIPLGTNQQKYFKALAYTLDSDGNGLPDWWEQKYFGSIGVNPYGDPMGDGYNNLYKYEHGLNPNLFYTPPAPIGLTAILNTNGNLIVSWPTASNLANSGAGAVTGYTLQIQNDGSTNYLTLGSNTLSFETNLSSDLTLQDFLFSPDYTPFVTGYALRVNYAHTNSMWSGLQVSFDQTCSVNAAIARGPKGRLYLAASAVPSNVAAIRVVTSSYEPTYPINTYADSPGINDFGDVQSFTPNFDSNTNSFWPVSHFDVPVSSLTNGLYQIPPTQVPLFGLYSFTVTGICTNGNLGTPVIASPTNEWDQAEYGVFFGPHTPNVPFFDGRTNIAQNVNMFLRGADSTQPFVLGLDRTNFSGELNWSYTIAQQTNYVWDSFCFQNHGLDDDTVYEQRNEFQPFEETSLFTNLIFNLNLFDSLGNFNNQVSVNFSENEELDLINPNKLFDTYNYITNNPTLPLSPLPSAVLDQTTENWICSPGNAYEVLTSNGGNSFTLPFTAKNIYGLSYQGLKYFGSGDTWSVASPGNTFSLGNFNFAQNVAAPVLDTVAYYFARPLIDPMPGQSTFSVTNTTPPLMIIPFGKQFYLTAWAKQSILNGYSSVYAFPQQYFDKAFLGDENGNITTNQTGILSEYGDFFPTQPGKIFLTTKADVSTSSVGTNVVNVIKLQLDVNHDGTMDTSFAGPDNTSADRPFLFWVNNDADLPTAKFPAGEDINDPEHPDYSKQNIPSQRDLEDWARLWICGLPVLPTNYDVILSWNAISGNPSINLAKPYETNGGTLYLTDTNIATEQAGGSGGFVPSYKFATNISSGNSYTFPHSYLAGNTNNCFLFEGAGIGKGELVLTILENGTNVASTSVFMDLHDVKDLYERATAINVSDELPPDSQESSLQIVNILPANPTEAKQLIVFAHGMNQTQFEYENGSETMFKRLYWSGYQGRFAAFRWPCGYLPPRNNTFDAYDVSEYHSWKSANAFKAYLTYLRNNTNRLAGYSLNVIAHSQGNIMASEALKEGAPFDNYILTQAAAPAHSYDTDTNHVPYLQKLLDSESSFGPTPFNAVDGGYDGYFTNVPGNLINFYNTNDFALASGVTLGQLTNWEEDQRTRKPENYSDSFSSWHYGYSPSTKVTTYYSDLSTNTVTDLFEKKAMVARSRSHAIGAQGGAHGVIVSSVDLIANFGIGKTRPEHSAQFTRPIQTVWPYYDEVLLSLGIPLTVTR